MMLMAPRVLYISDRPLGVQYNAQQNAFLGGPLTIPYLPYEQNDASTFPCRHIVIKLKITFCVPEVLHPFNVISLDCLSCFIYRTHSDYLQCNKRYVYKLSTKYRQLLPKINIPTASKKRKKQEGW